MNSPSTLYYRSSIPAGILTSRNETPLQHLMQRLRLLCICLPFAACASDMDARNIGPRHTDISVSLSSVNKMRTDAKAKELKSDPTLTQIAATYAIKIAKRGTLNHHLDETFEQRMLQSGVNSGAAENLTVGPLTEETAIAAWLRSGPHRTNILNPLYTRYGLSKSSGIRGQLYWVLILTE